MRYVTKIYTKDYDQAKKDGNKSASRFPLGTSNITRHLQGKNPIAIFAHGTHSRWFGFDVDTKEEAAADTSRIITTLETEGVCRKDIHVSFSGGKGYHIEVYINRHIRFEDWEMFARYILHKASLLGKAIEWRPTATNGHAWKLPLTLHPKTKSFAGFCDSQTLDVMSVQASYDYLFGIQQADARDVLSVLDRARSHATAVEATQAAEKARRQQEAQKQRQAVKVRNFDIFQTKEEKEKSALTLIHQGLPGTGTRWKAMRNTLIPYLKTEEVPPESARAFLIEWTKQQITAKKASTSLEDCVTEIDQLIKNFWPKVDGFYTNVRDVDISRADLEWVLSVTVRGGTRNARDLLWALLLLKKAYAKKDGTFFASNKILQKLLSKPRKMCEKTMGRQRDKLTEQGYIEYIIPDNSFKERKATVYKLKKTYVEATTVNIIGSVSFGEDSDARKLLKEIATKVYTAETVVKKFKVG